MTDDNLDGSERKPRREGRKGESSRDVRSGSHDRRDRSGSHDRHTRSRSHDRTRSRSHDRHRHRSRSHDGGRRHHRERSEAKIAALDGAHKGKSHRRNRSRSRSKDRSRSRSKDRHHRHRSRSRSNSSSRSRDRRRKHRSRSRSKSSDRKSRSRDRSHSSDKKRKHRSKSRDRSHSSERRRRGHHKHESKKDMKKKKSKKKMRGKRKKKREEIARLKKEMEDQQKEMEKNNITLQREIQEQRRRSKSIYVLGFCLVLAAIVGIAMVFVLRGRGEEEPATPPPSGAPSTPLPTATPTSSIQPSSQPSSLPSARPSPAPTVFEALFDPPSEEDCENILNGLPVENREFLIPQDLQINIELTLTDPSVTAEDLLRPLQLQLDKVLIPELLDCPVEQRRLVMVRGSSSSSGRQLQSTKAYRHAFGDAEGTVEFPAGKECLGPDTIFNPCLAGEYYIRGYLKEDLPSFRTINLVTGLLVEKSNQDPNFGLPAAVVQDSQITGVENRSPTEQPSSMPSVVPSAMPSLVPSAGPSKVPSTAPSSIASLSPTKVPSKEPTKVPTSSPTYDELADFFRQVLNVFPDTTSSVPTYTVPCSGNQGDIVVLARGRDRTEPVCLGHLYRDDYLDSCQRGRDPFTIRVTTTTSTIFNRYPEVVIGYMSTSTVDSIDCELNSLDIGTLAPSRTPSRMPSRTPSMVPSRQPSKNPSLSNAPSLSNNPSN